MKYPDKQGNMNIDDLIGKLQYSIKCLIQSLTGYQKKLVEGEGIEIDDTNPDAPIISSPDQDLSGYQKLLVEGTNITIDDSDPDAPVISAASPNLSGYQKLLVSGTNITINNTNPNAPVISAASPDLSGYQKTLVQGTNITIDNTNPNAPVISAASGGGGTSDGTYTPTFATVSGSITTVGILNSLPFFYTKVGNVVNVAGNIVLAQSSSGVLVFTFTKPPIGNNFTTVTNMFGIIGPHSATAALTGFPFEPLSATNTIRITTNSNSAGSRNYRIFFQYLIE